MRYHRLGILAAAVSVACASAADSAQETPWPFAITRGALEDDPQAAYLVSVLDLLAREADGRADAELRRFYFDVLGTQLAYVGEHTRATKAGDDAYGDVAAQPDAPEGPDPLAEYKPTLALDALVEAAASRQLVMINEEHRSSVQRAFANQLIAPLRDLGFNYLAVETLSEDSAPLHARGYPVHATGTYTRDPAFGDLIRRAIDLGYTVVPYEPDRAVMQPRPDDSSPVDGMNRRERGQAENIFARTFAKDPQAKVLVFGGRGHIAESRGEQWTPMGFVLAELSGHDPLTIDLYSMVEHSAPQFEHWAFKAVTTAGGTTHGPAVLVNGDGAFWTGKPSSFDVQIFHPRTRLEQGRPQWVRMGGLRKPVTLDLPAFDRPVLLQAFVANERTNAVPLDQVILWPDRPAPVLLLRPGAYVVRVIDRSGRELHRGEAAVY